MNTEQLIVTIGSNPLPVAVAIKALCPRTVHLVYTPQVTEVVNRLGKLLQTWNVQLGARVELMEHRRPAEWRLDLQGLNGACHAAGLHYTGGTKVMAVHVHSWFMDNGGAPERATYLGSDGVLYWDAPGFDPRPLLQEPKLSLTQQYELHFGRLPKFQDDHRKAEQPELADRIQEYVATHNYAMYQEGLPPLYGGKIDVHLCPDNVYLQSYSAADPKNFKNDSVWTNFDLTKLKPRLGSSTVDEVVARLGMRPNPDGRLKAVKWLLTGWLEVWLASQLELTGLFDEVHQSVTVGEKPYDFEADVVGVRGHRLFLFSCTTDASRGLVKSKLFEAAHRAARVGGDHARAAVLSFSQNPVEVLQDVAAEHWEGYGRLRAFGWQHLIGGEHACDRGGPPVTLVEGVSQWVTA